MGKRTLRQEFAELNHAASELGEAVLKALGPVFCRLGWHEVSVAHPHYCGRCGRHYGLRR